MSRKPLPIDASFLLLELSEARAGLRCGGDETKAALEFLERQWSYMRASLLCKGTESGKHEWRMGQWAGAGERPVWCCRCAQDATDIVDAALKEL